MISAKVLLMFTGALSAAVALRLFAPAMSSFLCAELPRVYQALLLWLTPPYLHLLINGIIISIAASSRFQKQALEEEAPEAAVPVHQPEDAPPPVVFEVGGGPEKEEELGLYAGFLLQDAAYGGVVVVKGTAAEEEGTEEKEEDEFVISRASWTPEVRGSPRRVAPALEFEVPAAEKPLVSARFGGVRKGVKTSSEGKAMGVAKPKKNETLEITWKAITDSRPMPLARHLKKSDTWSSDGGDRARDEPAASMKKSETFKEQLLTSSPSPGEGSGGRLRRETSLGQDELNRRVEAFIRKFNEEMRLERQESFHNYMGMINCGAR